MVPSSADCLLFALPSIHLSLLTNLWTSLQVPQSAQAYSEGTRINALCKAFPSDGLVLSITVSISTEVFDVCSLRAVAISSVHFEIPINHR